MHQMIRRRRMPYPTLVRWLVLCLPIGLYYLWHERYRWHWLQKTMISLAATAFTVCLCAGIVSLFRIPSPVVAQSSPVRLLQQDIYPLVVDQNGGSYHLEGCVHADRNAMPILLVRAAQEQIPADERCNPPRYDTRN